VSVGPVILAVEDDPRLQRLISLTLENDGYKVLVASDGESALEVIADHIPDLIILDLMLPGETSGLDVARTVRSFSRVPIIMLTSKAKEADKLAGFEAGADDYVTKPFSCPELKARIKAVLSRSALASSSAPALFRTGELEVDFVKRRAYFGGDELSLTQTEFRVLSFLAQNSGKVLLHEEILSEVWGAEYREEYQYLRNYIANLRKKIEPDPADPKYILSKPGTGYYIPEE
jgi:two-component system KDP operon response regulator KdpE